MNFESISRKVRVAFGAALLCGLAATGASAGLLDVGQAIEGDGSGTDAFGNSVSLSGNYLAVGAPGDSYVDNNNENNNRSRHGALYIKLRSITNSGTTFTWATSKDDILPSAWASVPPPTTASNSYFGYSVSIYGDTAVAGAPGNNPGGANNTGFVCIFRRDTGGTNKWGQEACINGLAASTYFGASVAIYGDTLAIGAPGTSTNAGAVYVYTRSGTTWTLRQTINRTGTTTNWFGASLALSIDPSNNARLVVGAPGAPNYGISSNATNFRNFMGDPAQAAVPANATGEVVVFKGVTTSGTWTNWSTEATLPAPTGLLAEDRFGYSVAISQTGSVPRIAVGAPRHNNVSPAAADAGAVYIYEFSSGWTNTATLEDSDHHAGDQFGFLVAISNGALTGGMPFSTVGTGPGVANAGEVGVWALGTGNAWTEQERDNVTGGGSGHTASAGDEFGWSVALAGNQAINGAPGDVTVGSVSSELYPCSMGRAYATGLWAMLAIPCTFTANTLRTVLGEPTTGNTFAHFLNANFDTTGASGASQWTVYKRDPNQVANTNVLMTAFTDTVSAGIAYWLKSNAAPTGAGPIVAVPDTTAATFTSLITGGQCTDSNGCFQITLKSNLIGYQMVGNSLPFPVDWSSVIVTDGTTNYTPDQANSAVPRLLSNIFWIYNGSAYNSWDATTTPGIIPAGSSFFVYSYTNTQLYLLIPAKPSQRTGALEMPERSKLAMLDAEETAAPAAPGLFDWLISPAAAAVVNPLARAEGWKIQLSVSIPSKEMRDSGNFVGLVPGSLQGNDPTDLKELPPQSPYLTIVFPHTDWGARNGDYTTDYHAAGDTSAAAYKWPFEIRTDQVGSTVNVGWDGDPTILKRCGIVDPKTNQVLLFSNAKYRFGTSVKMTSSVQSYVLVCQ